MYEQILYEVDDPVATITLNRPESLNGWTMRMAAEVRHAVARAEADRAVVGIIITGAGRAFCAGADMGDLTTLTQGGTLVGGWPELEVEAKPDLPDDFSGEYTYLLATSKPIVAAINGAIAGMAVTGGPAWRKTMSLIFCAHMVGKPVIAPDPAAAPAVAAAAFRRYLRERLGLGLRFVIVAPRLAVSRLPINHRSAL